MEANQFHRDHAALLRDSFKHLLGFDLIAGSESMDDREFLNALVNAPSVVVSHGLEPDPIFNFGNRAALKLFELDWDRFTSLPSRKSAEAPNRAERDRLLAAVTEKGFIDDYSGVRISASGRRFLIPKAIVWNLNDAQGQYQGQAATFSEWEFLD